MNIPFSKKGPSLVTETKPLPALRESTIRALEAMEDLHAEVASLKARNEDLFRESARNAARAEVLDRLLREATHDRDVYQRLSTELTTELQRVQTTIDDCFARAKDAMARSSGSPDPAAEQAGTQAVSAALTHTDTEPEREPMPKIITGESSVRTRPSTP